MCKPQHAAVPHARTELPRLQQLIDRHEIPQALGHLLPFDLQEAVVHPDLRHDAGAEGAARLGDLVFVVREDQVQPAAVDVEDLAQIAVAHGRAFDVPAGAAAAPGTVPARLLRRGELPQHEIRRVALVRLDRDAGACLLVFQLALRQRAVVGHGVDAEQHLARRDIGMAASDQGLDHRNHLADVVGGARLHRGLEAAQLLHVGKELVGRGLGHLADGLVQRQVREIPQRPGIDLVVHVRDVADIGDMVRPVDVPQQPVQHVEDDDRPGIADMGEVIDRRAADIHPHIGRIDGLEGLLAAGQRVVELQRHMGPRGFAGPGIASSDFRSSGALPAVFG